jgi:AcrR family transcriptional regulator
MDQPPAKHTGGRPTADAALRLDETILDAATAAFLRDGYAVTSIEAIARACRTAKRTIYARWPGKPALFRASVERLIARWMTSTDAWQIGEDLESALRRAATHILSVALTPEAIALHRLLIAETIRFPELPILLREAGAQAGVTRLAALLGEAGARGMLPPIDAGRAAEQFMHLLLAGPQRRALGMGPPLDAQQIITWRDDAIRLFLHGVNSLRLPQPAKE